MIICENVLSKSEVTEYLKQLQNWEEGYSALGSTHKKNLEIKEHPLLETINKKIQNHSSVRKYGFIKYMTRPRFNKYHERGNYSDHVDFFRQEGVRTDWSMTLFLTDDYEGGELVIDGQEVKLPAGDMVLYPSGQIHRVNPVTKGARIAVIAWAESFVESYENRKLLSHLVDVMSDIDNKEHTVKLSCVYNNLMKKWST